MSTTWGAWHLLPLQKEHGESAFLLLAGFFQLNRHCQPFWICLLSKCGNRSLPRQIIIRELIDSLLLPRVSMQINRNALIKGNEWFHSNVLQFRIADFWLKIPVSLGPCVLVIVLVAFIFWGHDMFGVFYTWKISLTIISENYFFFYIWTKCFFVYLQYTIVWVVCLSVCLFGVSPSL